MIQSPKEDKSKPHSLCARLYPFDLDNLNCVLEWMRTGNQVSGPINESAAVRYALSFTACRIRAVQEDMKEHAQEA